MTSIVSSVSERLNKFIAENGDPRTKDWPLMSSPWPVLGLLVVYVWGCTIAGPKIMKNRKPFQLNKVLVVYNAAQILGCAYIVVEGLDAAWLNGYSFTCQPLDHSDNPNAHRVARSTWLYFIFKIVELADTVFFVLRKKDRQLSTLHMYHHTVMPMIAWSQTRFTPTGHGTLSGLINCVVHIFMYGYYLVAALGPRYQRYLGWKSYITVIQLVQFAIVFPHSAQLLFRECDFPKTIALVLAFNTGLFLYMFSSFYYRSYVLEPMQRRTQATTRPLADKQTRLSDSPRGLSSNGKAKGN